MAFKLENISFIVTNGIVLRVKELLLIIKPGQKASTQLSPRTVGQWSSLLYNSPLQRGGQKVNLLTDVTKQGSWVHLLGKLPLHKPLYSSTESYIKDGWKYESTPPTSEARAWVWIQSSPPDPAGLGGGTGWEKMTSMTPLPSEPASEATAPWGQRCAAKGSREIQRSDLRRGWEGWMTDKRTPTKRQGGGTNHRWPLSYCLSLWWLK